jgi:O-antigen biosynthesis protein
VSAARRAGSEPAPVTGTAERVLFVLGAPGNGADVVVDALVQLGLRPVDERQADGTTASSALGRFHDRLFRVLDGTLAEPPAISNDELVRTLRPFESEARRLFDGMRLTAGEDGAAPWVWCDPRLSMLAPFWVRVLGCDPAAVLVHAPPGASVAEDDGETGSVRAPTVAAWYRYNRAGLAQCAQWPNLVTALIGIVEQPETAVSELQTLLALMGYPAPEDIGPAISALQKRPGHGIVHLGDDPPTAEAAALHEVLTTFAGVHDGITEAVMADPGLLRSLASLYDGAYYDAYGAEGLAYRRDEPHWIRFFAEVADAVLTQLAPRTALDVGCAIGMLVEALRQRGVDARGIDLSDWAIANVPDALRPYCTVGSVTEELQGHFDLITCVEVLEHLPPFLADQAVGNLCRHADVVLFSSTPDDFEEPTHLNVQGPAYWAKLFWKHGFVRYGRVDAGVVAPHAVVFKRSDLSSDSVVDEYEHVIARADDALREMSRLRVEAVVEHDRLSERYAALMARPPVSTGVAALKEQLDQLELRRRAEAMAATEVIEAREEQQRSLARLVDGLQSELDAIRLTKTFRYSERLRRVYTELRRSTSSPLGGRPAPPVMSEPAPDPPTGAAASYSLWVEQFDTVDDERRDRLAQRLLALVDPPTVSVVMPVYNPDHDHLRAALDSVLAQIYPHWELCIADDASTDPGVVGILEEYTGRDERVRLVRRPRNGHIAAASNSALELATGRWVASLDQDDVLPVHALAEVALAVSKRPDVGLVYSDEDKLGVDGRRTDAYFKPDFDPVLLLAQNYLTHFCVIRRDLVEAAGGYRQGFEGSQDWDLVLRVTESLDPARVLHIPHVLYHWRAHHGSTASGVAAKPYAALAGQRAVSEHLDRTGRPASVLAPVDGGPLRIRWARPEAVPRVSVVVPTRDGVHLPRCLESLMRYTAYPDYEIIVVDNGSQHAGALDYLRRHDGVLTVIRDESVFNYSTLNNLAVEHATGDVLCLLNDDTEIANGDWLDELVGQVLQPGVGAAGPMLCYDDGTVQHAGVIVGIGGVAGHAHRGIDRLESGYFSRLHTAHRSSALTAACMVVRRQVWEQVHGLDAVNLPVAFNDVDFCLRVAEAGWSLVWTPFAELVHHESASRGLDTEGERAERFLSEIHYMKLRWGPVLRADPYYNPNLTLSKEDFSLAWPPRVPLG